MTDDTDVTVATVVRWSRPTGEGCAASATVEIRDARALPVGKPVTITGDGGLIVELRRR